MADLFDTAKEGRDKGWDLEKAFDGYRQQMDPKYGDRVIYEHCMPFDVARACDEAGGMVRPQIWTAERTRELCSARND